MDHQKAMLAELMSQYVDVDDKDFWDDAVCKNYLVRFCPHLLFTNTKSDLGPCNKIHNDRLREKYQQSEKSRYTYEEDFYRFLRQLISEVSRKINHGYDRVNQQDEKKKEHKEIAIEEHQEKQVLLEVKIKELLQQSEEAGEEGRVDEASELTDQVEKLEEELKTMKDNQSQMQRSDKRMEVCEVCGALLVTNEAGDKPGAHFEGKQHIGYAKIREALHEQDNHRHHDSRSRYDSYRRRPSSRDHHRPYRRNDRDYRRGDDFNRVDHRRPRDPRRDNSDDDWNREMERYNRGRRENSRHTRSRSPQRW
ncbi:LUC7-domain-containing protein [Hesseltinella vesiculosa]|uniref:LUC7-domain-containing protein n=1 Tax=Hesseltinella vesiculosa TaxID=101127 RepID=A0A1X2G6H9_9FUNG|nr:LUC7-domain-containing protein [Hesseltinella vesiculosa]